jgi:hypothetical protein
MTVSLATFSPGYRRHVERHEAALLAPKPTARLAEDYARWLAARNGIELAGLVALQMRHGYREIRIPRSAGPGVNIVRRRYTRGVEFGRRALNGSPDISEPVVTILV